LRQVDFDSQSFFDRALNIGPIADARRYRVTRALECQRPNSLAAGIDSGRLM
jgi:hypothetical protein